MEIVRRGREAHVGQKNVSSSWTSLPKRVPGSVRGSVRSNVCYTGSACAPGRRPFSIRERDGDRVRLITRGGYNWTDRYPWIVEAALKNRHRQFVIDGEAVVLGVDGFPISTRCIR
jgi:hypothetical protein